MKNTSSFVTVIQKKDIEQLFSDQTDLPEIISSNVGVKINRYGGSGSFCTISIRGSTSGQVNVYIDGVPLNLSSAGVANIEGVSLENIERIEIYRGGSPSFFGSSAIGGVVNIVTKKLEEKAYKEISGGELCLLQKEVDQIELMTDIMLENDVCRGLIRGKDVIYEQPGITELEGLQWKGKADIVNHEEGLVIDLKTTGDIEKFRWSASKYNYDSQAYIYSKLFGYEMLFIVIDKNTHQIGIFDCSPDFYSRGADKVQQAAEQYKLFFQNPDFDPTNYFINKTL